MSDHAAAESEQPWRTTADTRRITSTDDGWPTSLMRFEHSLAYAESRSGHEKALTHALTQALTAAQKAPGHVWCGTHGPVSRSHVENGGCPSWHRELLLGASADQRIGGFPMTDEITVTRGNRPDGGPLLFAHADVSDLRVQAGPEWPDAMLDAGIVPGPALVGGSDPDALDALAARISRTADELRRAIRERWRCPECSSDRWRPHVEDDFGMRQCLGCQTVDRSEKQALPGALEGNAS